MDLQTRRYRRDLKLLWGSPSAPEDCTTHGDHATRTQLQQNSAWYLLLTDHHTKDTPNIIVESSAGSWNVCFSKSFEINFSDATFVLWPLYTLVHSWSTLSWKLRETLWRNESYGLVPDLGLQSASPSFAHPGRRSCNENNETMKLLAKEFE